MATATRVGSTTSSSAGGQNASKTSVSGRSAAIEARSSAVPFDWSDGNGFTYPQYTSTFQTAKVLSASSDPIIPDADQDALREAGVAAVFTPGAAMDDITAWLASALYERG